MVRKNLEEFDKQLLIEHIMEAFKYLTNRPWKLPNLMKSLLTCLREA